MMAREYFSFVPAKDRHVHVRTYVRVNTLSSCLAPKKCA